MRKLFLTLLLAGAVSAPALAQPADGQERGDRGERAEHQAQRAERQAARQEMHAERQSSGFTGRERVQPNPGVVQQVAQPDVARIEQIRAERHGQAGDGNDGVRNWRMQRHQQVDVGQREGFNGGELRQSDRRMPGVMQPRTRSPMVSDFPRQGTQPPLRTENRFRSNHTQWSTNWRHDRRYDWRDWRRHHGSSFHLGFYYDPFGWGYQPFSIGSRLWPNYYSSNYWLNDPWQYRLPYAPPGTQWIRYYNDAVLVDMYTGEVVDVIQGFFW
jgi:Ni/Co efflux regulator RcnB